MSQSQKNQASSFIYINYWQPQLYYYEFLLYCIVHVPQHCTDHHNGIYSKVFSNIVAHYGAVLKICIVQGTVHVLLRPMHEG